MFIKNCPVCHNPRSYVSQYKLNEAIKRNAPCIKCAQNTPKRLAQRKESYKNNLGKLDFSGENNPFHGKKHSEESRTKMGKWERTEKHKQLARESLSRNTNKRPVFDIWVEKYGLEIANLKLEEFKQKQRENNSGSKNSMFGKPSPQGSGHGWKGWYKGWFFRSLRELSYIVTIESNGWSWVSAENKKFEVKYLDWRGSERNYYPDFFVNEKIVIEVKPRRLWNTPAILAKRQYATEHFKKLGLEYDIVDPDLLPSARVQELLIKGLIKFLPKYEKMFRERYFCADNERGERLG